MGRHHIKLPDRLYLSPPSPQPSPNFTFSPSKVKSFYPSTAFIFETTPTARAIGDRIPGFKTSAAFFTALRANIDLQLDSLESPINTPDSLRPTIMSSSVASLPEESPLIQSTSISDSNVATDFDPPSALKLPTPSRTEQDQSHSTSDSGHPDGIPELTTFVATDEYSRVEALRLVADSVAQQRQRASRALIFHPITLAILAIALGAIRQYFYTGSVADYAIIGTTFAGVIMAVLVSIRALAGGYLEEAEKVGTWKWLGQGRGSEAQAATGKKVLGEEDEILVTKFGEDYIGAIIFRGVQSVEGSASKKARKNQTNSALPKTEIRAWTVGNKYRGKGVGTALLEDAIKMSYDQGWASGGIDIAADHANSKELLPPMFVGLIQKNNERTQAHVQKKAQEYLDTNSSGKNGKRRR